MPCSLYHVRISSSLRLASADGGVEVFVGRQSVTLCRSGLCSVVYVVVVCVALFLVWGIW